MKSIIHIEKIESAGVVFHNIKIEIDNIKAHLPGTWKSGSDDTIPTEAAKPEAPKKAPKEKTESVKQELEEAFAKTGLSTAEIADLIGVTDWAVRSWCLGYHRPTIDKINKISDLIGVSPREVQRILPRARRKSAKRAISRKRRNYTIEAISSDRFVAKDGTTEVTFTVCKQGPRTVLAQIEGPVDTPLAKKVARDGRVSGFGRVCQAARMSARNRRKA